MHRAQILLAPRFEGHLQWRAYWALYVLAVLALAFGDIGIANPAGAAWPEPTLFAPGVISGSASRNVPAFSSDGKTLFLSRYNATWSVLLTSRWEKGQWTKPEPAPFGGSPIDQQPAISPDGRYLIYVDGPNYNDLQLVRVDKTASGWSAPRPLPDTVNISKHIGKPSIAANGDLYFVARTTRPIQEKSVSRLYRAAFISGAYRPAQPLPFSEEIYGDANPAIAADQSFLVFVSRNRKPFEDGREHLYLVLHRGDSWGHIVPIRYQGDNWGQNDGEVSLSPDGRTLYFLSNRSPAVKADRTRAELLADYARMETWDRGDKAIWTLPMAPYLAEAATAAPD
jgi:hypothetical protein